MEVIIYILVFEVDERSCIIFLQFINSPPFSCPISVAKSLNFKALSAALVCEHEHSIMIKALFTGVNSEFWSRMPWTINPEV